MKTAGAVTFQTVQTTAEGNPLRLFLEGYEIGRPGGPVNLTSGHGLTESHYQIVVDASSGARFGEQIPLGPYRDLYTVVGLTTGMVTSAGDPVAWVALLDAQALQFAVPPALQRREEAAGRNPATTADINAVLVSLLSWCANVGSRAGDRALEAPLGGDRAAAGRLPDRSSSSRRCSASLACSWGS